jgi:hypothetical protein
MTHDRRELAVYLLLAALAFALSWWMPDLSGEVHRDHSGTGFEQTPQ